MHIFKLIIYEKSYIIIINYHFKMLISQISSILILSYYYTSNIMHAIYKPLHYEDLMI